jgi:Tol biopolymer transport system component/tRNA A-37 threonylcarbamoyl transferase component Bud32
VHTTDQLNTALAGRYEIERRIGAGGMATVYLARDIKHRRRVALKVLSPELGAVLGPERFLSEIEVTANLHHPHLLPLFDSGEADGLLFYVMPYIEGETLRQRLERERQLSIEDAVRIACAIASALDYAHRHGVIHRDLKPENVLLHENDPLVMDFGIALAVSNAGGARITQTGLSLGTPQYMSPEQATGDRQVDGRSDLYSLAAVLYEMLTGDPPHTGSTGQAIIARVITDRPRSIRSSRDTVPEYLDAAVQRALAKLPADRFTSASEFAAALTGARPVTVPKDSVHPGTGGHRRAAKYREAAAWLLAAGAATTLIVVVRKPVAPTSYGQFDVMLPESIHVVPGGGMKLAISRDGSRLLVAATKAGRNALYIRTAGDPAAQVVRGTDSSVIATFSPSGDWILFNVASRTGARQTIMKVPVGGGTPQRVADSVTGGGGSWGDDGHVLVIRNRKAYLFTNDGASKRFVGEPDTAARIIDYAWPEMLPGSKAALLTYYRNSLGLDSARIGVIDLANGRLTDLGLRGSNPHYVKDGHIVFGRAGGFVYAARFKASKRVVIGTESPILENVSQGDGGAIDVAVADNGMLIYHSSGPRGFAVLVAVDSTGHEQQLGNARQRFFSPRLAPDGRHVALQVASMGRGKDVWVLDIATDALSRLTSDSSSGWPVWSRDGARLIFGRRRGDTSMIVARSWDGSGKDSVLASSRFGDSTSIEEVAVGPTHGYTILRTGGPGPHSRRDLHIAPTGNLGAMRDFVVTSSQESAPSIAPSGGAVAYESNETGKKEIYVRQIPGPGAGVQISVDGGEEPVWSRDSRTLYYRTVARTIVAATIRVTPAISFAARRTLFADAYARGQNHTSYDVMADGRLLFVRPQTSDSKVMVAVDWVRLIKREHGDDPQ